MKKMKLEKKLFLNKEAIAKLNNEQLNVVKGGSDTCHTNSVPCTSQSCGATYCGCPASANPACTTTTYGGAC